MTRHFRYANAIKIFNSDRRGVTAVAVGLSASALVGMLALAMDASSAISAHARLRQAADVAALAAVRQAAVLTANNSDAPLQAAAAAGQQRFYAQANAIAKVTMPTATVTVTREDLTITATVNFRGSYATQLAGALSGISPGYGNIASVPLNGSVAAQQKVGAFVDIQVLMDTSNSMAITATDYDSQLMSMLTYYFPMGFGQWNYGWQSCTVACHAALTNPGWGQYKIAPYWNFNGNPPLNGTGEYSLGTQQNPSNYPPANLVTYQQDPTQYDFYAMARWAGVTLRIDLLKGAVSTIANAVAGAPEGDRYRVGFYTFDLGVTQRYALGPASGITNQISSVDVTPFPGGYPGTYWWVTPAQTSVGASIKSFTGNPNWMVAAGDGSSPEQAKKVVVIMTDGVEDYNDGGARVTSPFSAGACDGLKRSTTATPTPGKGANVFVLQAADQSNFISGGVDDQGNSLDPTAMFNASVAAMQACATDKTYYFLATSQQDIQDATNKIINSALSQPTVLTLAPQQPPPPNP